MGIIQQQTIKGTIFSYLGVLIGFLTVNIIQPHALTIEQVGLTGLLTSFSLIFAQFSILGFNGTTRYFPYFRSEENKHHGYLFLACAVSFIGIILFTALAYIFKNAIISEKSQTSQLFEKYYWYLVPLTFFTLFFNVFDLYARMLYNITLGLILKEFTKRIFVLISILLIYFKLISFPVFMVLWLLANVIPTILIIIRLIENKQFHLKPDFKFLDKNITKKLINICFFAIVTGSAPLIIQNIDTYIIFKKFGLGEAGIYTIAFFFATVISLPSRSLYSISYTIVAESWKTNDLKNIKSVYEKSCINQLISALFIFVIIWANIDNIFKLLPPAYAGGKYVIFFVSLGFLIDSATGINGAILGTSKYFKYDSLFNLMLIGVTIVANLLLIPVYGITGAAIASAITFFIFNLFRYLFILFVYKMQPFTIKSLYTILIAFVTYWICDRMIPQQKNFILDSFIRASFITVFYGLSVYFLNLSEDIIAFINSYLIKLKK